MHLLSFMSSFKCCKNFPLKTNFSESNFFLTLCCGALYHLNPTLVAARVNRTYKHVAEATRVNEQGVKLKTEEETIC